MHSRFRSWATGLLLALALLTGCVPAPAGAPAASTATTAAREPLTLTIVHTNDTWGYLRPCG